MGQCGHAHTKAWMEHTELQAYFLIDIHMLVGAELRVVLFPVPVRYGRKRLKSHPATLGVRWVRGPRLTGGPGLRLRTDPPASEVRRLSLSKAAKNAQTRCAIPARVSD